MAVGGALGGALGAVGGAFLGGPAGAGVGGALGSGIGALFNKPAKVDPGPPLVDPNMIRFKDELQRKRDAIASGVTTEYTTAANLINSAKASALNSVVGVTGGDVGSALAGMEGITRATGTNVNSLLSNTTAQELGYAQMASEYVNNMSNRTRDIQQMKHLESLAQSNQDKTDRNQAIMSTIGSPAITSALGQGAGGLMSMLSKSPAVAGAAGPNDIAGAQGRIDSLIARPDSPLTF